MRPRFVVDWDDTLVEDRWPDQGPWLPGAVEALRELNRHGDVVIFSCRVSEFAYPSQRTPEEDTLRPFHEVLTEVDRMQAMLDAEGLGHIEIWQRGYKPAATVYIDNRGVRFNGDWRTTLEAVYAAIAPLGIEPPPTMFFKEPGRTVADDSRSDFTPRPFGGAGCPCDDPRCREVGVDRHPSSQRFHDRVESWLALHDQKQRDYGSDADPFANVRGGAQKMGLPPWVGAVIRMNDKMERLNKAAKQYIETGQISLANEGVIDSFDDMGVYAGIGATLFEEES